MTTIATIARSVLPLDASSRDRLVTEAAVRLARVYVDADYAGEICYLADDIQDEVAERHGSLTEAQCDYTYDAVFAAFAH